MPLAVWIGSAEANPGQAARYERTHRAALASPAAATRTATAQTWVDAQLQRAWQPKVLNGLLHEVLTREAAPSQAPDDGLRALAEELALVELAVLVDECLEQCVGAGAADRAEATE